MVWWAVLAAAFAGPDAGVPFDPPATPPAATYDGTFASPPVVHWRVRVPGGRLNSASHTERSQPTVHEGGVFVGSASGDALYLLSRRDGSVIRQYPAAQSVEAAPAVANGKVYFADTGGSTWCYTLEGEFQWQHQSRAPVLVQPTIDAGRVFITNVDDLAVALDATTGELLWRYQARKDLARQSELRLYGAPPAVIADGAVLLGFSDGGLVGVDASSGEELWTRRIGEGRYPDLVAGPVARGADVFASGYFQPLVALDVASRNIRWRLDIGAASAPLVEELDGRAVIFHPGSDGSLRSISVLTGAEKWIWESGSNGALSTPVLTEAGLLIGSSAGGLWLLDPETGKEKWAYHEPMLLQGVTAAPTVAGRQLLFLTNAGYLHSMLAPVPSANEASARMALPSE
ncbi:MAG: outer membrane protein assembly factor BamB [Myxococcota bacterium]|jgi:outer membrane protein assembly factor BamB